MEESKSFSLNKSDLKKIIKGLGIALGGTAIAYILGVLDKIDVDGATAIYVSLFSALLNALKVFVQGK